MGILVLGSGAREHAIVNALIRTGTAPENITCSPGNAGIAQDVNCVSLDPINPVAVTEYAVANDFDLVVIGPEAPLIAGVSELRELLSLDLVLRQLRLKVQKRLQKKSWPRLMYQLV
jgi:phosphoribosylamine-glycine ligase